MLLENPWSFGWFLSLSVKETDSKLSPSLQSVGYDFSIPGGPSAECLEIVASIPAPNKLCKKLFPSE